VKSSMDKENQPAMQTFQDLILALQQFWAERGCVIVQPYDMPMGAGTFHPATFLRAIGPEPWGAAYVQPCRRPTDGRYGDNPFRLQHYYQYQVVIKPSPLEIQEMYLDSLRAIGIDPAVHDIRFVEDNWESPSLGAWGLGWEVWLNGMEITQFTYFQQVGGLECRPVTGEITYGLERLAMYLQDVESIFDITWTDGPLGRISYRDVYHQNEVEQSRYVFLILPGQTDRLVASAIAMFIIKMRSSSLATISKRRIPLLYLRRLITQSRKASALSTVASRCLLMNKC